MAVPTSTIGNIGDTLATTPVSCDVYTAVPGPTTTTPAAQSGPALGNYEMLADGTFVQFLQVAATTAAGLACKVSAWKNAFKVTPTAAAANEPVVAINDRSQASLSANYCTWMTRRGLAFPLCKANAGANKFMSSSSATAGYLDAVAMGTTDAQSNLVNTVLVGGSDAASPVLML